MFIRKPLLFGFLFILGLLHFQSTYSEIKIYPAPIGLVRSPEYRVFVNGKEVFVYNSPIPAAFCSFDMDAGADILITAARDIKWVDVRPLSLGIKAIFKDSSIQFHLKGPAQLSVELNGSIKIPLFIFANPFETNIPDKSDPNVIYFKGGKVYHPGIIRLKDNQTLYIEGGAYVIGVIKANHARNIRICGRGILDGTYNNQFNDSLIRIGKIPYNTIANKGKYNRFVDLADCSDVTIEGITLSNCTSWDIVPIHSRDIHINNIKIVSDNASDDGIDIVRCKNVLVENSFIRTKDDCIAVKADMDYPESEGVDSVLVQHCIFWNALWGNALEIGFELNSAEIKNVRFVDNDIIHVEAGSVFSIHNAGTAMVHHILYENIRVEDARQKLFDFAIFRSQYSRDGTQDEQQKKRFYLNGAWDGVLWVPANEKTAHAKYRGRIQDIILRNIQIKDGGLPFSICWGYDDEHQVKNVLIENLTLYGNKIQNLSEAKICQQNSYNVSVK